MELPNEILKQIGLLIDKPVSIKVTKQIHELLDKDNLNQEKAVHLFLNKYRSDMLIFMLQNNRFPQSGLQGSGSFFVKFCGDILKNVLQYRLKMQQIIQIYLLLLTKIHTIIQSLDQPEEASKFRKILLEIAYSQPIKIVIHKPNLQTKQLILKIICATVQYLYSTGYKKLIQAISENYQQLYTKYLIYVPSYTKMIEIIINIDYNSKKIINQVHPQRSENLEEIYIDLSSQQLYSITIQTIKILQNNSQKTNSYQLQKCCLKALSKIGQILHSFRVKEMSLYFKQIDLITILRECQKFIGVKGTIDDARACKKQWEKVKSQMNLVKVEKAIKIPKDDRKLIENNSNPIFIQNVIALTNNYRLKYEVQNPQTNVIDVSVSNNFLKKGMGGGGGKTFMQVQQDKKFNKKSYDKIVDGCFDYIDKEIEYKSYVEPQLSKVQQKELPIISKQSIPSQINLKHRQFYQQQVIPNQSAVSSYAEEQEDEQIDEINSLIDLAYSYKFST